jgi:hypothetical protein
MLPLLFVSLCRMLHVYFVLFSLSYHLNNLHHCKVITMMMMMMIEPATTPALLNYLFNHEEAGEAVRRHWLYCSVRKLPEMVVGYPSCSGGTINDNNGL